MFQPPTKKIKLDENGRHLNSIADNNNHTETALNSTSNNVSHNRKETTVHVDRDGKAILLSRSGNNPGNWCTISFGNINQFDGYRLGKIVVKLILDESIDYTELKSSFNSDSIVQRFPGLEAVRIQVEGQSTLSRNAIEFCTRRVTDKVNELKHFKYDFQKLNFPPALFGKPGKLDTRKIFKIEFEKYDAIYKEIILQVKLYASAIKGNICYAAPDMTDAIPVLDFYFLNKRKEPGMDTSMTPYRSSDDAQRFFSLMREYHSYEMRPNSEGCVQDHRLIPQLLDFQKEAVVWMLAREGVVDGVRDDDEDNSTDQLQKLLSIQINKRINLKALGNKCPQDAYYSRASGCLSWKKEPIEKLPNRGGILADEMGLGKTIEMLSVILLHPRLDATTGLKTIQSNTKSNDDVEMSKFLSFECPCGGTQDQQMRDIVKCRSCGISQHSVCVGFGKTGLAAKDAKNYLCPCCIEKLPSKATLIVVPSSILRQWEEEISNNISDDSLKIHIYSGISGKYTHPIILSEYDIVLTTYEVLGREIHYTDLNEVKRLRDRKRYANLPCPLILIEWWRVCLDEAQMVEHVNWNFTKVACMLPAVHRWCITGTPIQKDLQDLYGVVSFLGIEPINNIKWWEFLIMEPFRLNNCQITIISNIFGKIFWRTEKEDIQDQLRLPRQTEVIHRLEFSPVERYFYEQRSIHWMQELKANIGNVDPDQPISALNMKQIIPFWRLRSICTHPQLDEEAFAAVDIFIERQAKLTLTVPEFVEWVVKRVTAKCLKQYKLRVATLNAIAGLHLLKHELEDARRQYECVIQLAEENESRWNTDDVNLLHALVNLRNVIKKLGIDNGMAETLKAKVDKLIDKLMQNKIKKLCIACIEIRMKEIDGNFGTEHDAWWIRALEHIKCANIVTLSQEFVHKFRKMIPLEFMKEDLQPALDICSFVANLQTTLLEHLSAIVTKRKELFSDWTKINDLDYVQYLDQSLLDCGHFTIPTKQKTRMSVPDDLPSPCALCCFKSKLSNYESLLSRESEDGVTLDTKTMKSLTENALNVIYEFAKKNDFTSVLEDGRLHILQFRDLQNEVCHFWKWYDEMDAHDRALIKLIAGTKPIAVNDNNAEIAPSTSSQRRSISGSFRLCSMTSLEPVQIVPRMQLETSASDQSQQKLNDCLRELFYVKGLQMYGYNCDGSIVDINPKTCSVKHDSQKWIFLPCCHFFCANCHSSNARNEFCCPLCAKKFSKQVTRFVDMQSGSKHTVPNIPSWRISDTAIWRSPFTKVEGVIRTLFTIREDHPNDKALVICNSDPMLKVFAAEFDQNGISYILHDKRFPKTKKNKLILFRTGTAQVLLMPLSVASTGLNLTEANHVLLVEPCPNLAVEEQAIGRIHRLGQKKPTFLHRFFVADTIEEKLVRMDKNKKMSTFEEGNMTIQDLIDIFDDNLPHDGHYL